jgi:L-ascorbate oxidase
MQDLKKDVIALAHSRPKDFLVSYPKDFLVSYQFPRSATRPFGRSPQVMVWLNIAFAAGLLATIAPAANAQTQSQLFANPQELPSTPGIAAPPKTMMALTREPAERAGAVHYDLDIDYTDSSIKNPATGRYDKVHLRSYKGPGTNPAAPFVAPTIVMTPGGRIGISLHNKLKPEPSCLQPQQDADIPHCFNSTNLHAHGMWVSPTGNSDNVLVSVHPGVSFDYEYNIPADHPAGTYWYHSHLHGSTALQVSSGMAGALIVRGDRLPTPDKNGDIDTLLRTPSGEPFQERVLVLQQIQYACLDANGQIKVRKDKDGNVVAWVCDTDDVGVIEFYNDPKGGEPQFGPRTWGQSGRFTSINGVVAPTFDAKVGEFERWRMIHAGVRETITVAFRKKKKDAPAYENLTTGHAADYIKENCSEQSLPYYVIAADGLTMAAAQEKTSVTLQPGYRWDALVAFPEEGKYCVVNETVPSGASVSGDKVSPQYLGTIDVSPGAVVGTAANLRESLAKALVAGAQRLPEPVRATVIADLNNGLKLTKFTPHRDIAASEITGQQGLVFFIHLPSKDLPKLFFAVSDKAILGPKHFDPLAFRPNPYDPTRIDRTLTLGGVDEWTLQAAFVSHPFHIHINPFQIAEVLDPSSKDISGPDGMAPDGDLQYRDLKGVWKDTLWVKSGVQDFPTDLAAGLYTIKVRTRYQRFIGEYVLHCHILDHEDQGMMQNVQIVPGDGAGGVALLHH